METKWYLLVKEETDIVKLSLLWDGNLDTWQPPAGYILLERDITPILVWKLDKNVTPNEYVLSEEMISDNMSIASFLGSVWNGSVLTTNQPKPELPQ